MPKRNQVYPEIMDAGERIERDPCEDLICVESTEEVIKSKHQLKGETLSIVLAEMSDTLLQSPHGGQLCFDGTFVYTMILICCLTVFFGLCAITFMLVRRYLTVYAGEYGQDYYYSPL